MKQTLVSSSHSFKDLLLSLQPYLRKKRIRYSCVILSVILLIAAVLSFVQTAPSDILPYLQNVEVLSHQGKLYVLIDDTALDYVIHAEKCHKFCASLDGRIAAFLTDTKELYLVQGNRIKKIADDVHHFEISSSGSGIAFAQKYAQQYALTLYDLKEDTRKEITAQLSNLDFSLSPDGQNIAYYSQIDGQDVLMYRSKGEEQILCREKSDLVGLSNDGKQIYLICPKNDSSNMLYAFNHRGKATKLGLITSMSCKFNADHQQIMFYNNGKTMVSVNGKPATMASNHPLYLVTAPNSRSASDGNSITLPVSSLFDHVYTCSDGESTSAWLIRKDPQKSKKMISRVSGCTLDASGKYLYYIHNLSQLCVMDVTDGNPRSHILTDNVDTYAVRSNRSKVYFTHEGKLYCANGKKSSTPKLIATDAASYNLAMSRSDVLFYLSGSDLYSIKNGNSGTLVAHNIQSFYSSSNGVVYIIGDGNISTAYNKKQPAQIIVSN